MRPTKRVARLRATNNSCLYSFPSLVLSRPLPLSLPFILPLLPANSRTSSSSSAGGVFPSFAASPLIPFAPPLVRRSNSNSCRERIRRGRLPSTFEAVGSKSDGHRRPDNQRPSYLPLDVAAARFMPIILLRNYRSYFSIRGETVRRQKGDLTYPGRDDCSLRKRERERERDVPLIYSPSRVFEKSASSFSVSFTSRVAASHG